jgi:hypothetical protein
MELDARNPVVDVSNYTGRASYHDNYMILMSPRDTLTIYEELTVASTGHGSNI